MVTHPSRDHTVIREHAVHPSFVAIMILEGRTPEARQTGNAHKLNEVPTIVVTQESPALRVTMGS